MEKAQEELYEKFMDSWLVRERREILMKMHREGYLTDKILTDFAVVTDLTIQQGDLEDRYYDMLRCLDSMARFETTGLR